MVKYGSTPSSKNNGTRNGKFGTEGTTPSTELMVPHNHKLSPALTRYSPNTFKEELQNFPEYTTFSLKPISTLSSTNQYYSYLPVWHTPQAP